MSQMRFSTYLCSGIRYKSSLSTNYYDWAWFMIFKNSLSDKRRKRLIEQGNIGFTKEQLSNYAFGFRFAYFVCGAFVFLGYITDNLMYFYISLAISIFASIFAYHPIDYLYNYGLRYLLKRDKLPHRSDQGRFACRIATVWIISILFAFSQNLMIAYQILTLSLLVSAILVSIFDICIPSMIYNKIFKIDINKTCL